MTIATVTMNLIVAVAIFISKGLELVVWQIVWQMPTIFEKFVPIFAQFIRISYISILKFNLLWDILY